MAKNKFTFSNVLESNFQEWCEGELIETFNLRRIADRQTPLMQEWLQVDFPTLNIPEQYNFDKTHKRAVNQISGWNEEDLKMKFIGPVLELGHLLDENGLIGFFDRIIAAEVDGIPLRVKADFMLAKGTLNVLKKPFFHFQEYKPTINPTGEPMAQLLEAFLIAQAQNNNDMPLYGAEVIGRQWSFVIMEGKEYCISKLYDSTDRESLLKIIAILRKFKEILETRLLFL